MNVTRMGSWADEMLTISPTGMLVNMMAGEVVLYMSRWMRARGREIVLEIQQSITTFQNHTRQYSGGVCLKL